MENVITCDETWIFQYDPETKRQSMHWKTPYLAENQESSNEQVQIEGDAYLFFFYIKGIIMIEWVPQGQTVNQKYYIEVLIKFRERVRK